jgi:hypothetical protein
VFEEVRVATLMALFILGTDVVPEIYSHDGKLRLVTHNHIKAVTERRLGKPKTCWRG